MNNKASVAHQIARRMKYRQRPASFRCCGSDCARLFRLLFTQPRTKAQRRRLSLLWFSQTQPQSSLNEHFMAFRAYHDFRHESVATSYFSHASRGPQGMVRPGGCLYQSRVGPLNWTFETVQLANARARPRQEAAQGCKRPRREGFGVHRHRRLESDRQIGGTSLFSHRWPRARCSSDFKKGAASNLPLAAKSLGTGMQAPHNARRSRRLPKRFKRGLRQPQRPCPRPYRARASVLISAMRFALAMS
jgi:hypothetical protein